MQMRVKLYRLGVKNVASNKKKDGEEETKKQSAEGKIDVSSAEWIEMGIGPLKVLRQKAEDDNNSSSSGSSSSGNKSSSSRIVMRREDKKGGIGRCIYFIFDYLSFF